ncbi:hypothetical protein Gura_0584 [Geotalea uraniireducens Rf4]|uniref:Uncharacterized protein n=1 Tax=Geotalea uraniireducens (strain Rf4) TaxID=351605 RepID=A5GC95_GEOUR|nr:hypothetical protein Gura_0584 [Geotalea uraniireducens Rf4]
MCPKIRLTAHQVKDLDTSGFKTLPLFSVDKNRPLPYPCKKIEYADLLIKSGGGKGPVKPQQPVRQRAPGAKSCRMAKMREALKTIASYQSPFSFTQEGAFYLPQH